MCVRFANQQSSETFNLRFLAVNVPAQTKELLLQCLGFFLGHFAHRANLFLRLCITVCIASFNRVNNPPAGTTLTLRTLFTHVPFAYFIGSSITPCVVVTFSVFEPVCSRPMIRRSSLMFSSGLSVGETSCHAADTTFVLCAVLCAVAAVSLALASHESCHCVQPSLRQSVQSSSCSVLVLVHRQQHR